MLFISVVGLVALDLSSCSPSDPAQVERPRYSEDEILNDRQQVDDAEKKLAQHSLKFVVKNQRASWDIDEMNSVLVLSNSEVVLADLREFDRVAAKFTSKYSQPFNLWKKDGSTQKAYQLPETERNTMAAKLRLVKQTIKTLVHKQRGEI